MLNTQLNVELFSAHRNIRPWRLGYQVKGVMVEIVAFLDSRRNLEDLLYQRALETHNPKIH